MSDLDSFSTVVSDTPKDGLDSFSSVVEDPKPQVKAAPAKPVAPTPKKSPGIMDKISEGFSNLAKEHKDNRMVDNLFEGGVQGVTMAVGGATQLAAHGVAALADKVAPGSAAAKWLKQKSDENDADIQKHEDAYQKDTKGSVAAGVGRIAGSIAVPFGTADKAAKGASLASKIGASSYAGAKVAAVQPVFDLPADGSGFAKAKAGQVAAGAALGAAAPVASKALLEAAAKLPGKLGGNLAEQALTNTRKAQLFDKSPNAKADAEVITELGGIKDRVGDRKLLTADLNARQSRITEQTKDSMKAAGATPEQLTQLKTWQGMTTAEKEQFRNTEMGAPVAAIMDKLDRIRALTPGELSSNLLGPVRGALDLAPIPAPVRFGLKNLLGGRTTRAESAAKMLDARSQRAAQQYLEANGASDATKGAQTLQDMGAANAAATDADSILQQRLAAQNKSMTENPSMLVPSLADPVERENTLSNLKTYMMNRDKELTKNARLMAKQNGPNPSLVVPSLTDVTPTNSSKALKADMLARAKEQVEADKVAQAAKDADIAKQFTLTSRNVTKTPGGGAYQSLLENTGASTDELNRHLRTLSNHPEFADEVNKIRVDGGNTTDGVIYPITDMVKTLMAKEKGNAGALTQAEPTGILSIPTAAGLDRVTANQQLATNVRQRMYDKAKADSGNLTDPQARAEAKDLAEWLKSTPERTERVKRIDELATKYPETKEIFSAVRKFKSRKQ